MSARQRPRSRRSRRPSAASAARWGRKRTSTSSTSGSRPASSSSRRRSCACRRVMGGAEVELFGVVEQVYRRSTISSMHMELAAHDGDPVADDLMLDRDGVTYAKARVVNAFPPKLAPPIEGSTVFSCSEQRRRARVRDGRLRRRARRLRRPHPQRRRLDGRARVPRPGLPARRAVGAPQRQRRRRLRHEVVVPDDGGVPDDQRREGARRRAWSGTRAGAAHQGDHLQREGLRPLLARPLVDEVHRGRPGGVAARWASRRPDVFRSIAYYAPETAQRSGAPMPIPTERPGDVRPYSWSLKDIIDFGLFDLLFSRRDARERQPRHADQLPQPPALRRPHEGAVARRAAGRRADAAHCSRGGSSRTRWSARSTARTNSNVSDVRGSAGLHRDEGAAGGRRTSTTTACAA